MTKAETCALVEANHNLIQSFFRNLLWNFSEQRIAQLYSELEEAIPNLCMIYDENVGLIFNTDEGGLLVRVTMKRSRIVEMTAEDYFR